MRQLRRRKDKGSALVDFAVSSVVILSVLVGIIDVGRALYAYDWVSNAARKGTRFMIVRGTGCGNDPVLLSGGCPANSQDLTNYITNANGNGLDTTGIDTSQVVVGVNCYTAAVFVPPPCAPGGYVQVTITYTFKFITPFLTTIHPWQMSSQSRVVVQN